MKHKRFITFYKFSVTERMNMSTKKETEKLIESELNEIYFDGLSDDSETACRVLNVWKNMGVDGKRRQLF